MTRHPLYWPCNTRLAGRAFAVGDPSLVRHGTNHKAVSGLRERTLQMASRICRKKNMMLKNMEGDDSTHVSRNFLRVRCSASWFLVFASNLIWILGSKMILSINQSRATLWVLDVGLRPLIIILITASLSSKMYNWDSPWEERVLVVRNPLRSIDQPLVFYWHALYWFWNHEV